jgi:GMP synthase-like glutamine amidotransferase
MKPVAIVQHAPAVGPGYFATWLREQGVPSAVIRVDRGEPVPDDPRAFAGICSLGGPMSANDPLPWIERECALLRAADAAAVPVIGHCLGGQLLARALGAKVMRNAVKEIGWGKLEVTDGGAARDWLGGALAADFEIFQWHGETFELPAGARNFLASRHCARQAFVIDRGRCAHLGMQFHCEMTPELVREWASDPETAAELHDERAATGGPGIQDPGAMLDRLEERVAGMNAVAARLYARWSRALHR